MKFDGRLMVHGFVRNSVPLTVFLVMTLVLQYLKLDYNQATCYLQMRKP
mgnify:CR=1 FL=1